MPEGVPEAAYPPTAVELRRRALQAWEQRRWADAEDLFRQAFEAGQPIAACAVASLRLSFGDGEGALPWFGRAAERGVTSAAVAPSRHHHRSTGIVLPGCRTNGTIVSLTFSQGDR
jgi:TPR repeat protein